MYLLDNRFCLQCKLRDECECMTVREKNRDFTLKFETLFKRMYITEI